MAMAIYTAQILILHEFIGYRRGTDGYFAISRANAGRGRHVSVKQTGDGGRGGEQNKATRT